MRYATHHLLPCPNWGREFSHISVNRFQFMVYGTLWTFLLGFSFIWCLSNVGSIRYYHLQIIPSLAILHSGHTLFDIDDFVKLSSNLNIHNQHTTKLPLYKIWCTSLAHIYPTTMLFRIWNELWNIYGVIGLMMSIFALSILFHRFQSSKCPIRKNHSFVLRMLKINQKSS